MTDQHPFITNPPSSSPTISVRQQRKSDDDAVRSAFWEHGPFARGKWSLHVPDADLEAYLDADYDTDDESESVDSVEARETDPLLAAGDLHTRFTHAPSSRNRPVRQHVLESYYLILDPRQRRRSSPASKVARAKCTNFGLVVLGLILLGIIYLWSPVLKEMLFPEDQSIMTPVQGLT